VKKAKAAPTGEIRRYFIKHKVYGTVYAVDADDSGTVLASAVVTEAIACRHTLAGIELTLDEVDQVNKNLGDYEVFEPVCSDPKHLLGEIGDQELVCQASRSEMLVAHAHAKECKETYEKDEAKLRSMVREATSPTKLPLFDKPTDDKPADQAPAAAEPWYLDAVNVKRCTVCLAQWPCGIDHNGETPRRAGDRGPEPPAA
jgi:hypothetical protein